MQFDLLFTSNQFKNLEIIMNLKIKKKTPRELSIIEKKTQ